MANYQSAEGLSLLSRSFSSHSALNRFGRQDDQLSPNCEDSNKLDKHNIINNEANINLSYCGCGFLGMYHLGVASAIQQFAPHLSVHKISGVSAGSLVAVAHLCGNLQLADALTAFLEVAIDARSRSLGPLHPAFNIQKSVKSSLEQFLPNDIHLKASGRLHVSLTRVRDGKNVVVNQFDSKDDVIRAILCSCFIPVFSGMIAPKFRGVRYVDGGFSNNQIVLDEKTVTVSPFFGECDICPKDPDHGLITFNYSGTSIVLTSRNLYRIGRALIPWSPDFLFNQCEQGFADGIRYLKQTKLISCTRCMTIQLDLNNNDIEINETLGFEQTNTDTARPKFRRKSFIIYTRKANILFHNMSRFDRCFDCDLVQRGAPNQSLPVQFNEIFDQICDQLNKSISAWLYSHRPIYYLSCMAIPYYLPLDLSLVAVNRSIGLIVNLLKYLINNCGLSILEYSQELLNTLITSGLIRLKTSEVCQLISYMSGTADNEINMRELFNYQLYHLQQVFSVKTSPLNSNKRRRIRRRK